MIESSLGVGPLSSQIIEAAFLFSQENKKSIMLIASKNQVDYSRGYVNNWTTKEYVNYLRGLKKKYPSSNIIICRDHCGPGFNGKYDLEDTYKTIKEDIECGFDLIHIDFSKYWGTKHEKLEESKKAIEYCLKLNPNIKLEIGTDENLGKELNQEELQRIREEIAFFKNFCKPEFYVVQTGSLIKEINQRGKFNKNFVENVVPILKSANLRLKEHNADYLNQEEIIERSLLVGAMNIAPQLGVVQTSWTLKKCLQYGIPYEDFFNEVIRERRWEKWLDKNSENDKMLCFLIGGHYHFNSPEYQKIIDKINRLTSADEEIIKAIKEVFRIYV
jgi:hypothetical protein